MVRLIIRRTVRDSGHVRENMETLNVNNAALEQRLAARFGGGPDNEDFCIADVVGAEVRKP